jgi:hypothetical protein
LYYKIGDRFLNFTHPSSFLAAVRTPQLAAHPVSPFGLTSEVLLLRMTSPKYFLAGLLFLAAALQCMGREPLACTVFQATITSKSASNGEEKLYGSMLENGTSTCTFAGMRTEIPFKSHKDSDLAFYSFNCFEDYELTYFPAMGVFFYNSPGGSSNMTAGCTMGCDKEGHPTENDINVITACSSGCGC